MGAHMKKRILPVIIAILLILVIAGGALGKVLLDKYSYSKEEADWNEFYQVSENDRSAIILQNEMVEEQALIKDKKYPNLCLLPSAQTRDKSAVSPEQMQALIEDLRQDFDYILLDCPAGIEQGFKNAIAGADRALVVTTPEVSAVRDADRIIGLLEQNQIRKIDLIINRIRMDMVKRGDMMSVDDVTEILSVPLIGILPDDEQVVIGTNQGEPVIGLDSTAGKGYLNICKRILGLEVPYINLDTGKGFFSRISHAFKKN